MQVTGIADKIMRRVRAKGRGKWVCTARDFLNLGNHVAVGQALSRLAKKGDLRRVGHGLYDFPYWSQILKGWAPADMDAAVAALARRDNIRIMEDGGFWANRLGLTNAVPARTLYTTDGATREVAIDGRTVYLQHASPKVMALAGRGSAPIVQALRWLGPLAVRDKKVVASLASLKTKLPDAVKKDLARASADCPPWIIPIVRDLAEKRGEA